MLRLIGKVTSHPRHCQQILLHSIICCSINKHKQTLRSRNQDGRREEDLLPAADCQYDGDNTREEERGCPELNIARH